MSDGQHLVGGYDLKNCVANGKTTQIWEVTEHGGTMQFAMKLMLEEARKKSEEKAVLKHEFKTGKIFEHPGIVRFHKLEISRDHAFFIMDYFRAPSLKVQIATNLPEVQSRFAKIADAVCAALGHVHEKGWLHRDVKPDNILVNKTGETRLIDFSLSSKIAKGIGKLVGGRSKIIQGTRTYISPEAILRRRLTEQSDIYSLGVSLFELLTGVPTFAGLDPNNLLKKHLTELPAPPSALNPNVTPELDQVILKMLAKKQKDRYVDTREVQAALRSIRCFQEDPLELHERRVREAKEQDTISVDKRLDSRADADRTTLGLEAPKKPVKGKRKTAPIGKMEAVTPRKGAPAAQPQQPQQPMPGMMPQFGMPQPMMMPPQMMMPQMYPPGMMPQHPGFPGQMPPGQMPPGQMPPGQMPPGQMPPGQMPPGQMPPGQMPPGQMPPGQMPPGQMPPGQMPPGQMPPGQMPPGQMPPGQMPPGQMPPGQMPAPQRPVPAAPPAPIQPPAAPAAQVPQMQPPAMPAPVVPPADAPAPNAPADAEKAGQQKGVRLPLERRPAQGARSEEVEDLDFMTDLPDIL